MHGSSHAGKAFPTKKLVPMGAYSDAERDLVSGAKSPLVGEASWSDFPRTRSGSLEVIAMVAAAKVATRSGAPSSPED